MHPHLRHFLKYASPAELEIYHQQGGVLPRPAELAAINREPPAWEPTALKVTKAKVDQQRRLQADLIRDLQKKTATRRTA